MLGQRLTCGLIGLLLLGWGTAPAPATAAAPQRTAVHIERVGQIGGESNAVAVQGSYAYFGIGPRLAILNIADPAKPEFVGQTSILSDVVQDVAVAGDYVYIADYDAGLRVINVGNPSAPVEVGAYDTPGLALGVAVVGSYAYIADYQAGLRVINVTDPTAPVEVGAIDTPGYAKDVAVAGSYAYVADWDAWLRVIDVEQPAAPVEIGAYKTPGAAYGVAVVGNYAYVADQDSGLRVINVAQPAKPVEVGAYNTPGQALAVAVAGSYAYVADFGSGLRVIDVANPAAPTEINRYYIPENAARSVVIAQGHAYVLDQSIGLRVLDVTRPTKISAVGAYATLSVASDVAVAGSYAYTVGTLSNNVRDYTGLRVINVTDPTAPAVIGINSTQGIVAGLALVEDHAYIAGHLCSPCYIGLQVLDTANPAAPIAAGAYTSAESGFAQGLAVAGAYAYIAIGDAGLRLVNVANPAAPYAGDTYNTPGFAADVAVAAGYAYVADGNAGLRVINLAHPATIGVIDTPGSAHAVALAGNYAYVADDTAGLRVINITTPTAPREVGAYVTPGAASDVAIAGRYAYVLDGAYSDTALRVIDVTNPAAPVEVGSYRIPWAGSIAVAGPYAYVTSGTYGLIILRFMETTPSTPTATTTPTATPSTGNTGDVIGVAYHDANGNNKRDADEAGVAGAVLALLDSGGAEAYTTTSGVDGAFWFTGVAPAQYTLMEKTAPPGYLRNASYTLMFFMSAGQALSGFDIGHTLILTSTRTTTATPTATPSRTSTPTPTATITLTPTATHTPTAPSTLTCTPTATPSPTVTQSSSGEGDPYEPDDACTLARFIPTDGTVQHHTFHKPNDPDWVAFNATAGVTYLIQGDPPAASPADLVVSPYASCGSAALPGQDYSFSPGVRLQFQAQATGPIYLKLVNHDPTTFGPHVAYDLSVRASAATADRGALVLVAGRRKDNDLQANIHQVAAHAYRVFLNHGYTADDIYYLATDLTQPGADALATKDDLAAAITSWANDRVSPDRPLTVYLVDHGEYDRLMLDDLRGEYLAPDELDGWLAQVEQQHPGLKVNVIIEACLSGSFIDLPKKVSRPGRVVIASTAHRSNAYASAAGAYFSDQFLDALDRNSSLYAAFQTAHWGARVATAENQIPWLDDNGNGTPNEAADGLEAQRRGFTFTGTLANDKWPPYIVEAVAPATLRDGAGTIRARVLDNPGDGVRRVWAVIYPPSYQPPPPDSGLVQEALDSINFTDRGSGWFEATYRSFDERGAYRVAIYAEDGEGLQARPVAIQVTTGWATYLPLLIR